MEAIKILIIPQVAFFDKVEYKIEEEKITITIDNVTDVFDFIDYPDGEVEKNEDTQMPDIETKLDILPIIDAYRKEGCLYLTIFFWVSSLEEREELLDLGWLNPEDFKRIALEKRG